MLQESISKSHSSIESQTPLLERMQDLVCNVQAQHKEKFKLEDVEITDITPQRDIKTNKADRLSISYEEQTLQGLRHSTQYYKIYDPLIIDNFDKYLEQKSEHGTSHQEQTSKRQEYTTNQGERKDVPKKDQQKPKPARQHTRTTNKAKK